MSLAFPANFSKTLCDRKLLILQDRARMLAEARQFFSDRNVMEVDCPMITRDASVDAHIDLIKVAEGTGWRYLHSSPEYGMKRLLADGIGDIYQLAHVFRNEEQSEKHNPEFMMAEWYRLGISFEEMIEETIDFVRLFLGKQLSHEILSYREAFKKYAGIDYLHSSSSDLMEFLISNGIIPYKEIEHEGKDALLNLILGAFIEPHLGKDGICVLAYYPSSQAALAKTCQRGDEMAAERFEIYYQGIELANGYHELIDASEQRTRFHEANDLRQKLGKETLPIDERFLTALEKGLPDCCGVAVGFDRLIMLRNSCMIEDAIPFSWTKA